MKRDIISSAIGIVVLTLMLGILYPLVDHRDQPGRVPRERQRPEGLRRRQARRLEDHRPAVHRPGASRTASRRSTRTATRSRPRTRSTSRAGRRRPCPPYNAAATTFSNLGPNNTATEQAIAANIQSYIALEKPYVPGLTAAKVPVDAANTSASGIDPDISPANADIQAHRVAAVRHLPLLAGDVAGLQVHARARARVLRRAGRQRARAQPRPRPSDGRPLMSVDYRSREHRRSSSAARSRCSAATSSTAR